MNTAIFVALIVALIAANALLIEYFRKRNDHNPDA